MNTIEKAIDKAESNLKLWNKVSETPTKYVKDGQQGLSSISTQYYFMKATEIFGMIGVGWGYDITDRYITNGAEVKHEDGSYMTSQMTIKINFWFKIDGKEGKFEQFGHTPLIMKTKRGAMMDSDPEKKSLSDAIKKSLTMLGFCADVHLNEFDNMEYMRNLREKEKEEEEIKKEGEKTKINNDINNYVLECKLNYQACTTAPAINLMCKADIAHMGRECKKINRNPQPPIDAIKEIAESRKKELK